MTSKHGKTVVEVVSELCWWGYRSSCVAESKLIKQYKQKNDIVMTYGMIDNIIHD